MEAPTNSLIYLQYGAMHKSFTELAQEHAVGVIVSAVTGLLQDDIGTKFAKRYLARFGESSTPQVGCQCYNAVHHYAIAASVAGRTGDRVTWIRTEKLRGACGGVLQRCCWNGALSRKMAGCHRVPRPNS
jgi:branched-chain amino acid transport system substrate-binding protein